MATALNRLKVLYAFLGVDLRGDRELVCTSIEVADPRRTPRYAF